MELLCWHATMLIVCFKNIFPLIFLMFHVLAGVVRASVTMHSKNTLQTKLNFCSARWEIVFSGWFGSSVKAPLILLDLSV